jgi:hypothetical protein
MVYTLAQKTLGAIKRREEPQQSNEERFLQALTDGQIEDLLASLVELDSRRLLPPKKNMIKRDRKERKRHSLTHDRLHLGQIREHTRPFKMH